MLSCFEGTLPCQARAASQFALPSALARIPDPIQCSVSVHVPVLCGDMLQEYKRAAKLNML